MSEGEHVLVENAIYRVLSRMMYRVDGLFSCVRMSEGEYVLGEHDISSSLSLTLFKVFSEHLLD